MGLFSVVMTDRGRRLAQDHLAGLVASPDPNPTAWFALRADATAPLATPGDGPGAAAEDASREGQHYSLVWEAAPAIVAGDRVEVRPRGAPATTVYEVARPPFDH